MRIPVYYLGLSQAAFYPRVTFSIGTVRSDETAQIDWSAQESLIRSQELDESQWELQFPLIQQAAGPTWGEFVRDIDESLELRLHRYGARGVLRGSLAHHGGACYSHAQMHRGLSALSGGRIGTQSLNNFTYYAPNHDWGPWITVATHWGPAIYEIQAEALGFPVPGFPGAPGDPALG